MSIAFNSVGYRRVAPWSIARREPARVPSRYVMAVFAGNGLQFDDFFAYAFFVVYFGKTFPPVRARGRFVARRAGREKGVREPLPGAWCRLTGRN